MFSCSTLVTSAIGTDTLKSGTKLVRAGAFWCLTLKRCPTLADPPRPPCAGSTSRRRRHSPSRTSPMRVLFRIHHDRWGLEDLIHDGHPFRPLDFAGTVRGLAHPHHLPSIR